MKTPLDQKSSIEDIGRRFDHDVERFANMEAGQQATMDAPLALELITRAALAATNPVRTILDIGCGAGNNTLKLLQFVNPLDCDLVDVSRPMLDRARERVGAVNKGRTTGLQGDFRTLDLPSGRYDVIVAAAVLHHLRDDRDWEAAFRKIFDLTSPGGSVWITDLVAHEMGGVQDLMWERYGAYLESLGGEEYRKKVLNTSNTRTRRDR